MGIKDFLKKGTGLDLVTENEKTEREEFKPDIKAVKETRGDAKMLKQLELDISRAIEKLEDVRDKLRVKRGY